MKSFIHDARPKYETAACRSPPPRSGCKFTSGGNPRREIEVQEYHLCLSGLDGYEAVGALSHIKMATQRGGGGRRGVKGCRSGINALVNPPRTSILTFADAGVLAAEWRLG